MLSLAYKRNHMNIRTIAIALMLSDGKILVSGAFDSVKKRVSYRPLGGGVEFGEKGCDAIEREILEEMSAEIHEVKYLTIFENIFTSCGEARHEMVLLYDAKLADLSLYEMDEIPCIENGKPFTAKWVPVTDFIESKKTLYPDGLLEYIQKHRF